MADDVLSRLQNLLAPAQQLQQAMGWGEAPQSSEWQAPPGFWDAIMKPPTDLPLPSAMPMNLAGGDRVFQPGGTIGAQLGQNALGIYGRSVPMGNQDTVVPPGVPQAPAMPQRRAMIDPNALPLILRRVMAGNPLPAQAGISGALNQLMAPR